MSQQSPAWFGYQLHQHQTETNPAQSSHLSHVVQHSMLLPNPPTTISRVRLSGPGLPSHQWFSSYQTGNQTVLSADKLQHSQPAHALPPSSMTKETIQVGLPSPRSIPNAVQHAASHAVSPATVKPVSHVMSHDTLPGPALRPCSPWRRTASQADTAAVVPSSPPVSVIIAADRQQPGLAAALGFPESTDFDAERISVNEQPHTGEGDNNQCNPTALPHEASAAHQPSVADAADCVPEQVIKPSLINPEGAKLRSSSSKHHRPRGHAKRQIRAAGNKQADESPKYMLVMRNLNKRQYRQLQGRLRLKGVKVNNWDHLMSWLSPAQRGSHTPWWTFIFAAALLVIFFFMAGSFGMYLAWQSGLLSSVSNTTGVAQYDNIESHPRASAPSAGAQGSMTPGNALSPEADKVMLTDYSFSTNTGITAEEVEEWMRSGPSSMTKWVSWQADWRLFGFDFLLEWGGRYGPALHQGQWWRWMTWVFVHEGFQHMVSNVLVWLALALPLEHAYGTPRILAVWLISALGSAFFSAAFEDSCTLVVGCSGAVFGFMGLYVADMVLNFKSLSFPWLRLIWIGATLAYFLVASITQGQGSYISYWAHLGGFVCGLFPSFFFLPNLKDKRWQAASKLANRLGLLSRNSGKRGSQQQRKRPEVGISHSIRKVSSRLHRHRHSESLMTSYLRMQAATAEAEVATGRQLSRESFSQQAVPVTEGAMGRHIDRQPDGHVQEELLDDGHSVQVSGYSQASQLAGQRYRHPASGLGAQRGAAGQADDTRGICQPCSDFKLGYYFRGIARQEEKLQAKADAQRRKDQSRTGNGSAAPAAPAADLQTNSSIHLTPLLKQARLNKMRKQRKQNRATYRQQRSQCCGVPVHLVVVVCMSVGATAVLGVFVALPLYLYFDRFPHMEC
ncbi:hypothetical protein WJX77_004493 [Trebouxia sp. C0004]